MKIFYLNGQELTDYVNKCLVTWGFQDQEFTLIIFNQSNERCSESQPQVFSSLQTNVEVVDDCV